MDISSETKALIDAMQPKLAQMLGQFGSGMRIFLFNAKKENGEPVYNIFKKNKFTISWKNNNIKWNLPFASVFDVKHCPVDQETMQGNWEYCPIHGVKLN